MASKTDNKSLASVYAQALYGAAQDAGAVEQVGVELESLRVLLQRSPKFETFLTSPTVEFADKRKVLEGTFSGFSKTTRNFLLVLVDRDRASLLDQIASEYIDFANTKAGVAKVEVHSASKLEDADREQLISTLAKKLNSKIKLDERVRPELIGGLVLVHEDKMWDASISSRLKGIVEKMDAVKLETVKWNE